MDVHVIEQVARHAVEGKLTFSEATARLTAAGVERYHTDLAALSRDYVSSTGEVYEESLELEHLPPIGIDFLADDVKETLELTRQQRINYLEFVRRMMQAGVCRYDIFLAGHRAIFTGRLGLSYATELGR